MMRSRNEWPGSTPIRTTIRSDSTRVPPVTAERSPPLSRMTGADSPVTADSSTDAIPSITSPSPGITSPASTTTTSPLRSAEAATFCSRPSTSLRAVVSCRRPRSAAACALPRPSASASAKLAKGTVNQSQAETLPVNHAGIAEADGASRSRIQMSVVSTLPTSTTNMTGFFAIRRGSSFHTLSFAAARRIGPSQAETARTFLSPMASVHLSGLRDEVLDDRAQAERREERERADDHDHADEQHREERAVGRQRAQPRRRRLLARQHAGDAEGGDDHQEASRQHR